MILREATIQYKGYDPEDLSKGSNKKICYSCDMCGRVKYIQFKQYKNLCRSCSHIGNIVSDETRKKLSDVGKNISDETRKKLSDANKGKNNGMYNKHHTNKSKQKISKNLAE